MKARYIQTIALSLGLFLLCGASCRQARLEPGGAYAPVLTNQTTGVVSTNADLAFYQIESVYAASYAAIDGLLLFEKQNRAALWAISPNIKHTLDKIRPEAWSANVTYHKARKAYIEIPVPANLTVMQQSLTRITKILSAVQAVMPKAGAL